MPSQSQLAIERARNKRRAFLKFAPLGAAFVVAPVVSSAETILCRTADDPMRGKIYQNPFCGEHEWSMLRFSKTQIIGQVDSEYVSSHMERRPDGKYVLVFDREK